jgi:opacity protein-like surface antigen
MKKLAIAALAVATSFSATAVLAGDANPNHAVFVNVTAGSSHFRGAPISDKNDQAYSLSAGYRWAVAPSFGVGVEAGYALLGTVHDDGLFEGYIGYNDRMRTNAITLGANLRYTFADNFYLSGRAGAARLKYDVNYRTGSLSDRVKVSRNGYYLGLGFGYDISRNIGVGVQYDNYRATNDQTFAKHANYGVISLNAEVRF